jgi:hypothetical protein
MMALNQHRWQQKREKQSNKVGIFTKGQCQLRWRRGLAVLSLLAESWVARSIPDYLSRVKVVITILTAFQQKKLAFFSKQTFCLLGGMIF